MIALKRHTYINIYLLFYDVLYNGSLKNLNINQINQKFYTYLDPFVRFLKSFFACKQVQLYDP